MGMPQIPDGANRPNMEEVVIDLFESIALEEMAISHILNAEGEKLQAIVSSYKKNEIDICTINKTANILNQTISDLIIKEWLLINKFNSIKEYSNNCLDYTGIQKCTYIKKCKKSCDIKCKSIDDDCIK